MSWAQPATFRDREHHPGVGSPVPRTVLTTAVDSLARDADSAQATESARSPCWNDRVTTFLDRLRTGPPLVADGGMGSLVTAAVPRLRCPEEANVRAPEAVVSLHVGFIDAGAELIEANTFGANRRKLAQHYLEDDLERINSAAIKLARDAREIAGKPVLIAGSLGPLGESASSRVRREVHAEQASILEGRGADVLFVETFSDLQELEDAIEAVRSVSSLPVVALLTFDETAETPAGVTAREAAELLTTLDVAAFGANHGAGLLAALAALEQMRSDFRSRRCRTSASPASPAVASSTRTRRPSTSRSSRLTPASSGRW